MITTESPEITSQPPWLEGFFISLALALPAFAWIASLDGLSIGWDTLNHHLYLGWMAAEGSRLQQDIFAAGSMSCQYPFSYAPLYWLQVSGASGREAAMILALPAVGMMPAVWLITWALLPRSGRQPMMARLAFTTMGFLSPLWWSLLDSTSNDILSSLPMVWAFSLVIWRSACDFEGSAISRSWIWNALAGILAALSLVLKISHTFALLGLLIVTISSSPNARSVLVRISALTVGGMLVAFFVWWPWAQQIWKDCGSPFYPMFTDFLRPLPADRS